MKHNENNMPRWRSWVDVIVFVASTSADGGDER